MTDPLTVSVRTLGCKVNRVESDQLVADLLGRGVLAVDEADADVVVINTCTVTGEADAKARKAIRHALDQPNAPVVVVTGCLAAIDADAVRALGDRVVVESDKTQLMQRVAELTGARETPTGRVTRTGTTFPTRALVKIEDGCDNRCSYCIIPDARGLPRSVPLDHVVDEVSELVRSGVAEVVLTGINIGRYAYEGADLADLVTAVARTQVPRIRLSSIEPPDLTGRLLTALSAAPAFCRHLHVPLQSGSDDVLAAMNRSYTIAQYQTVLDRARAALPGVVFTTDVIAGFPGETDEDHQATERAVEDAGFVKLHVFRYSPRRGTPAAGMPQVDAQVKSARASRLRDIGQGLEQRFLDSLVGRDIEVLIEEDNDGFASGTSREYAKVRVDAAQGLKAGDVVLVRVHSRENSLLCGLIARQRG